MWRPPSRQKNGSSVLLMLLQRRIQPPVYTAAMCVSAVHYGPIPYKPIAELIDQLNR
jgi:hypothetical protein